MNDENTETLAQSEKPGQGDVGEIARLFLRLGFTAFGGPAAHISMMQDEVVTRRRWLSNEHFIDLVGATNFIPGPNSTEMAIHIGWLRAGWRGLIVAGVCFIAPAMTIVLLLAWLYVHYGATPNATALLYGIKPVIVAIVLQAIYRLAPSALKGAFLWALAAVGLAAFLLGVSELVILFGGALIVVIARTIVDPAAAAVWLVPLATLAQGTASSEDQGVTLWRIFWVFFKVGALLFGSGYVLLAFLRNDLVVNLGWLTDQQLLDAVAIGQFTPGPVFTTATFIGYVLAGFPGAIVATVAIFLPSFLFVALLTRIMPLLRTSRWSAAFLDGVNAMSIALMAGVTLQLGRAAIIDIPTIIIGLTAAALLIFFRLNSTWLVIAGGATGIALSYLN